MLGNRAEPEARAIIMMGVLRRVTRNQLLAHLEAIPAAPFHWVRWNGEPLRLEQAQELVRECAENTLFYVRGEHIFGPLDPAPPRSGPDGRVSA